MLLSKQKEDITRNKQMVKEISNVLILCGRQTMAIGGGGRGDTEDKGDSMIILHHVSKHDEILVALG